MFYIDLFNTADSQKEGKELVRQLQDLAGTYIQNS